MRLVSKSVAQETRSSREGSDGSADGPLHPWPEEGWGDVARAQCGLPCPTAGESPGTPAVARVEKAAPQEPHLLITAAARAAKGDVQAEVENLPYLLFVNGQVKSFGHWS